MILKVASFFIALIFSITSTAAYPHELASALRPTGTKNSSTTDALSADIGENFNIPQPDASSKDWINSVNSVRSAEEFKAIKAAFEKSSTLTGADRKKVKNEITLAEFWVNHGKSPDSHHNAFKDMRSAAGPDSGAAEQSAKKAQEPDQTSDPISAILSQYNLTLHDVIFNKINKLNHKIIITEAEKKKQLFVIKQDGEIAYQGPCYFADAEYKFFIFAWKGSLFRLRFEDSGILIVMEPGENLVVYDVIPSRDGERFLIYAKQGEQFTADIYDSATEDFSKPLKIFSDVGEPREIGFSEDNQRVIFEYADGRKVIMDIQTGEPLVSKTAAPAVDKALNDKINKLNAGSVLGEFIEYVNNSTNQAQLRTIKEKFNQKQKVKPALQSMIDKFLAAVAAREKEFAATEAEKEIELAPDETDSAKAAARPVEDKKSAVSSIEKLSSILKKAADEFNSAQTEQAVDSILKKYLNDAAVKKIDGLSAELTDMADRKKGEIGIPHRLLERFDSEFDAAVSTQKAEDEHSKDWLKKVRAAFYNGIDQASDDVVGKDRLGKERQSQSGFYKEMMALENKMRKLFECWYEIIFKAANAKTFSELDKLEKELKAEFSQPALRMKIPQAYINGRRKALGKKEETAIKNIKLKAGDAGDEFIDLYQAIVDYDDAIKALRKIAKEKLGFENLTQAAEVATLKENIGIMVARKIRLMKNQWEQLKSPLEEAIVKRNNSVKQLRIYRDARDKIYSGFKPGDLCLATEGEAKSRIDEIVKELLDQMLKTTVPDPAARAEIINKYYKEPQLIENGIRVGDKKYLQPLALRLKLPYHSIPENILAMNETEAEKFLQTSGAVSTGLKTELKTLELIGNQA